MDKYKINLLKISLGLLFLINNSFAQNNQNTQFQDRNTTELVLFESVLPVKNYNLKNSDLLVKWHILLMDLIEQTDGYTPNVAARSLAYIDLAGYEAIVPAFPKLNSLTDQIQDYILPSIYKIDSNVFISQLAYNNAVFTVVNELFIAAPYIWMEKIVALKEEIDLEFSKGRSTYAIMKSKNYGISIGELILKYAETDGGAKSLFRSYDLNYRLPKCESCFEINRVADLENTGPLHPLWGNNRTFLKENNTDFEIKPEIEFSKYKDSPFYNQAKEVYEVSKSVTAGSEKHIIANFWDDAAGFTYTAVGHSVSILSQFLRESPCDFEMAARYYVTLSIGLNDAMISAWKSKYKHNLIRPIAYIKKYIDSQWEPTLLTPPFPEFPSGHSVQSATMATILTGLIGENKSFVDYSKFWVGAPRKFQSFWEAANETSISRLYGGIHYREALSKGQIMGKKVGENVLKLEFTK